MVFLQQTFLRITLLLFLIIVPGIVSAQHMIVDDAAVSEQHAFEAWGGTEESWIQPSIVVNDSWNLGPGIIFNTSNQEINATNWLIESKIVPNRWKNNKWGVGNVSALVLDFDSNITQVYSYVPISRNVIDPNSFLHLNLGFEANNLPDNWEYFFTTGFRADITLSNRVLFLSEVYTFNFKSNGFQAGFRFIIIPGQLESDITYGRGFDNIMTYPGFNIGISFTPY